MICDLIR